jgi:hypothetical protein
LAAKASVSDADFILFAAPSKLMGT